MGSQHPIALYLLLFIFIVLLIMPKELIEFPSIVGKVVATVRILGSNAPTFDHDLDNGDLIPIEERGPEEVVSFGGQQVGPAHVSAYNPAFDVTPWRYISALITEKGVLRPPYKTSIRSMLGK